MWNVIKIHQVEAALFQYNRRPGGNGEQAVVTIRKCSEEQWRSHGGRNEAGSMRWQNVLRNEYVHYNKYFMLSTDFTVLSKI